MVLNLQLVIASRHESGPEQVMNSEFLGKSVGLNFRRSQPNTASFLRSNGHGTVQCCPEHCLAAPSTA